MFGKDLLPLIAASSKTERMSQNLMKWVRMRRHQSRRLFVAFAKNADGVKDTYDPTKTQASRLYIGFYSLDYFGLYSLDAGRLSGSRLTEILCNGNEAQSFAFPPKFSFEIIPGWWNKYIEGGKCFIDPEHLIYPDRKRWQISEDGKTRKCLWCNDYVQYEHVEIITQREWRSIPQIKTVAEGAYI